MSGTLSYSSLNTPVGPVFVAVTERGVIQLGYVESAARLADEMGMLGHQLGLEVVEDIRGVQGVFFQLILYFEGKLQHFDLRLDWRLVSGFQREVLKQVQEIPYGETASYREIAIRAGSPNAYRAAGTACGKNPLLLIIPCHRVVKADGGVGGYGSAGVQRKEWLLEHEGSRNSQISDAHPRS